MTTAPLTIDKTVALDINGSRQFMRLCASRPGRPPLLIVQGGPGLPLLQDVAKFQRRLNLENDFLVGYWEQRGCGNASSNDAHSVTLAQQVEDLRTVLRWFHGETGQRVVMFGVSWGGTIALKAAEHEADRLRSVIGISADLQTARSDATADAFLREKALHANGTIRRRVMALERPPYLNLSQFQRRARLLADLGAIEHEKRFARLFREFVFDLVRTYGVAGAMRALRNMNTIQRSLLPEIAGLDLLGRPPHVTVPVHYVFGEQDALTWTSAVTELPSALAAPGTTVRRVANAGHMAHFDQPAIVRSVVERA